MNWQQTEEQDNTAFPLAWLNGPGVRLQGSRTDFCFSTHQLAAFILVKVQPQATPRGFSGFNPQGSSSVVNLFLSLRKLLGQFQTQVW